MSDEAKAFFCLSEELFDMILHKLPIKSLIVCTSVCKTWNSIIKSPSFVSSHLSHTISSYKENDTHLCLLRICSIDAAEYRFSLRFDDQDLIECTSLQFPYRAKYWCHVFGSCNGLVLLMNGKFGTLPDRLFLWNPIVRKSLIISEKDLSALFVAGLGFDSRANDYKVLTVSRIMHSDKALKFELYSLNANSWKQLDDVEAISHGSVVVVSRKMAFLNGVLHFVALRRRSRGRPPMYLILGFDLQGEVFHEIMLPDGIVHNYRHPTVHVCGESLAVVRFNRANNGMDSILEIWVMKEYAVEGSWTKLSNINISLGGCARVLGFRKNGHVLLSMNKGSAWLLRNRVGQMVSCDPMSQEIKDLKIHGNHYWFFFDSFVESLILLDKGNELSRYFEVESRYMTGTLSNATSSRNVMDFVHDDSSDEGSEDLGED
ncbi:hypothetical protein SLEP1_g44730 [Rubroshorea leprosula]|uniref:F-box domain-containing protein n=1 Tax=Rubroshorea leprosula TaxID=152421 RepID=A0AAV5LIU5_9ROSI|nr:hypothetical protein SLEP1_g44730 [Rubroshorea leprosula]